MRMTRATSAPEPPYLVAEFAGRIDWRQPTEEARGLGERDVRDLRIAVTWRRRFGYGAERSRRLRVRP